jgi:hypothetical protein
MIPRIDKPQDLDKIKALKSRKRSKSHHEFINCHFGSVVPYPGFGLVYGQCALPSEACSAVSLRTAGTHWGIALKGTWEL